MDTHKKVREHISALSDGALPVADLELALAALHTPDGQYAWNTYHRIGDVLRAEATPALSECFNAKLWARLAAEPQARRHGARGLRAAARQATDGLAPTPVAARTSAQPTPAAAQSDSGASDAALADAKAVLMPKPAVASVS